VHHVSNRCIAVVGIYLCWTSTLNHGQRSTLGDARVGLFLARGLCNNFAAKQLKCTPWDMNERKNWRSRLLTTPVAVAVASIKHVSNLEA
jgi:hypothetical protein